MIYLDNSATTEPDPQVLETYVKASSRYFANPASLHRLGNQAEDLLESARSQIKGLLGYGRIIFTSGGTEANNLAIRGAAHANQEKGRHIISCKTEPPSVLEPLKQLEKEGFEITLLSVDRKGAIDLADLQQALRVDTILVSLMQVNNEIGTIHPLADIRRMLNNHRALFHVDAVQGAGKLPLSEQEMPDLLTVSAHKFHGLKNSGVLAVHKAELEPILFGGGQEGGLRSGTVSVPNAAALAKALRLATPNPDHLEWNAELRSFFAGYKDIYIVSPSGAAPHILAVAIAGMRGETLVGALQQEGVIVSTSSACSSKNRQASHVIEAIGLPREYRDGTIRISFGAMTTHEDISELKKRFHKAHQLIKGVEQS
ncbi:MULTISPECIES: cysteine desulfurase family protein [unclassified Planococcus (in: firmicutes)]|uniref:cysteine desulfurase family protein n=1 Tax=unclassified Planococcus (in: firmicutes) TaxID=2662419 RepID=UPI000C32F454|nr:MULTISPECIES: cysteine desulfurase family protein [unclassified Planococcus (in: firmicutes)]AUD13588.1 aminotransferase [Planococcus sp. MB-3u-03]PKG46476.1 aminotransferase [Planococcus sp. Urea-trap-24]PKG89412.1 aminotransferase [Planococcus sp. Urea-3u-39]PKH41219.1 aminotransferase [Planococcus sp. MB-3u-09]